MIVLDLQRHSVHSADDDPDRLAVRLELPDDAKLRDLMTSRTLVGFLPHYHSDTCRWYAITSTGVTVASMQNGVVNYVFPYSYGVLDALREPYVRFATGWTSA